MDYKKNCLDYKEDHIYINGERKIVCEYFDLDTKLLCNHDDHNICVFYFIKKKINDPWLRNFMDEFSLMIVGDNYENSS